ncbi:hypothetical protein LJC59_06980 [Desulfovibrio sp. OttesenSCG-928-A18]|nr:hypothetical protein [Desulfovibrio sp. OttesenSCG-928-A18]
MSQHKYRTRYGIIGADEAAFDLLERACFRLDFLKSTLHERGERGGGVTLPGYSACGLAGILEDIAHDVGQARYYYYGLIRDEVWNPEPGKTDDIPEVES